MANNEKIVINGINTAISIPPKGSAADMGGLDEEILQFFPWPREQPQEMEPEERDSSGRVTKEAVYYDPNFDPELAPYFCGLRMSINEGTTLDESGAEVVVPENRRAELEILLTDTQRGEARVARVAELRAAGIHEVIEPILEAFLDVQVPLVEEQRAAEAAATEAAAAAVAAEAALAEEIKREVAEEVALDEGAS